MSTTAPHVSERPNPYRVLGTRPIRHDGLDKVTGAAKYGADLQLAGMRAIATSADFPIMQTGGIDFANVRGNPRMIAENVLAQSKVLYQGHAVAAVAATPRHIAEAALQLIEVDYEILPTVRTLHEALQPDAPLLHEGMTTRFRVERMDRLPMSPGNILAALQAKP